MNVDNLSLPPSIKSWLNLRLISDDLISGYGITYSNGKIVIPVKDEKGQVLFNKYRKDPGIQNDAPKYTYDKGATIQLFNRGNLANAKEVIICEGEFDCILLNGQGFISVTSTGGATSFQEEWGPLFKDKEVYVVMDNDMAGSQGILKVCHIIPHAKRIYLPDEVGEHGDVTDYFVKLGRSAKDFRNELMTFAAPLPQPKAPKQKKVKPVGNTRLEKAKSIPIENFLKFSHDGFAKCIFHSEKTASLKKYPNNTFKCFGCGMHGDVVDIYAQLNNLPNRLAIAALADM